MTTLPLVECFGPTLQGEGPAAGRPATFVRFGGCNLACTWCDTPYTWDASRFSLREQITRVPVDDVLAKVAEVGTKVVVLTGGEPLLHQDTPAWIELLRGLRNDRRLIHLETNGTLPPSQFTRANIDLGVVSPKLPHADAGRLTNRDPINKAALHTWSALAHLDRAVMKVVVRDVNDCRAAIALASDTAWPAHAVWLMPEGTSPAALAERWQTVAEFAARYGCNATHRLHVLAWGDERGH